VGAACCLSSGTGSRLFGDLGGRGAPPEVEGVPGSSTSQLSSSSSRAEAPVTRDSSG
jgi:hypothetical protein